MESVRTLAAASLLGPILAGCARTARVEDPAATRAPAAAQAVESPREVDRLIDSLRALRGEFRFIDPEQTGYVFTGGEALFRRIAELDSAAVPKLIECLGSAEPAAATFEGRPVYLAVLCFQPFMRTQWFQARRRTRSLPLGPGGVGAVRLRSTPEELVKARNWWRAYLAAGAPLGRP